MSASAPSDAVRGLAAAAAASAGLVLEDVSVTPVGRRRVLRVVVDLPQDAVGGVPMEAVAAASRAISAALDEDDVMGGSAYVLEVSSPGVDRPLVERRHFARARGRLVRVVQADGGECAGRLAAVDDEGLTFEDGQQVAWPGVVRGQVQVEFSRPGAAEDPGDDADDADDADEIDEGTEET